MKLKLVIYFIMLFLIVSCSFEHKVGTEKSGNSVIKVTNEVVNDESEVLLQSDQILKKDSEHLLQGDKIVQPITGTFFPENLDSYVIKMNGSASCIMGGVKSYCWGFNSYGMLGTIIGHNKKENLIEYGITTFNSKIQDMGLGNGFICYLLKNGEISCIGGNKYGQLGSTVNVNTGEGNNLPLLVKLPEKSKELFVKNNNVCVLSEANSVYCWGNTYHGIVAGGKLGDYGSSLPQKINIPFEVSTLTMGDTNVCALTLDKKIYCWGENIKKVFEDTSRSHIVEPLKLSIKKASFITDILYVGRELCFEYDKGSYYMECFSRDKDYVPAGKRSLKNHETYSDFSLQSLEDGINLCVISSSGKKKCWKEDSETSNEEEIIYLDDVRIFYSLKGYSVCYISNGSKIYCKGKNKGGVLGVAENYGTFDAVDKFKELTDDLIYFQ